MRKHFGAVMLALILFAALPGYCALDGGRTGQWGVYDEYMEKRFEKVCGPLPSYKDLITGVDVGGFVRWVLGEKASNSRGPWASPWGVDYYCSLRDPRLGNPVGTGGSASLAGGPDPARKLPPYLNIRIGVFASQQDALQSLASRVAHSSVGFPPIKGYGDRSARYLPTDLVFTLSNALVELHTTKGKEGTLKAFADELIEELRGGSKFVTRGSTVPTPRITSIELPDPMPLRKQVNGKITLENADISTLLVGDDPWSRIRFAKSGSEIAVTVESPESPVKGVIYFATPRNVMGSKEITMNVK